MQRAVQLSYDNLHTLDTDMLVGMQEALDKMHRQGRINQPQHDAPTEAIRLILSERG